MFGLSSGRQREPVSVGRVMPTFWGYLSKNNKPSGRSLLGGALPIKLWLQAMPLSRVCGVKYRVFFRCRWSMVGFQEREILNDSHALHAPSSTMQPHNAASRACQQPKHTKRPAPPLPPSRRPKVVHMHVCMWHMAHGPTPQNRRKRNGGGAGRGEVVGAKAKSAVIQGRECI